MSDCIKCWETPCACGWDYRSYPKAAREYLAAVVLGVQLSDLQAVISAPETHPKLLDERWRAEPRAEVVKSAPEGLKATIEGKDFWSRVVVRLKTGVRLCDINCHSIDVLRADPSLGDWHTMSPDLGEPECRFQGEIEIE